MKHTPLLHAVSLVALLSMHINNAQVSLAQAPASAQQKATKDGSTDKPQVKPTRTKRSFSTKQQWLLYGTTATLTIAGSLILAHALLRKKSALVPDVVNPDPANQVNAEVKVASSAAGAAMVPVEPVNQSDIAKIAAGLASTKAQLDVLQTMFGDPETVQNFLNGRSLVQRFADVLSNMDTVSNRATAANHQAQQAFDLTRTCADADKVNGALADLKKEVAACQSRLDAIPGADTLAQHINAPRDIEKKLEAALAAQADRITALEARPVFDDKAHAAVVKEAQTGMADQRDLAMAQTSIIELQHQHKNGVSQEVLEQLKLSAQQYEQLANARFRNIFGSHGSATTGYVPASYAEAHGSLAERLSLLEGDVRTLEQKPITPCAYTKEAQKAVANASVATGATLNAFETRIKALEKSQMAMAPNTTAPQLAATADQQLLALKKATDTHETRLNNHSTRMMQLATTIGKVRTDHDNLLDGLTNRQNEHEQNALKTAGVHGAALQALGERLKDLEDTAQAHAVAVHAQQVATAHGALPPTPVMATQAGLVTTVPTTPTALATVTVVREPDKILAALAAQATVADPTAPAPLPNAESRARATLASDTAAADAHARSLQRAADAQAAAPA